MVITTLPKNWRSISQIKNWCLKMALAQADPDTDEGQRLIAAFPDCFAESADPGPIPWSVLKEAGRVATGKSKEIRSPSQLGFLGVISDFGLPYEGFWCDDSEPEGGLELAPEEVRRRNHGVGNVVTMNGKNYIVVSATSDEVQLTPAECIDLTS